MATNHNPESPKSTSFPSWRYLIYDQALTIQGGKSVLRVPSSISVRDAAKNADAANGHHVSSKSENSSNQQQFPPVKVSSSTCQLL